MRAGVQPTTSAKYRKGGSSGGNDRDSSGQDARYWLTNRTDGEDAFAGLVCSEQVAGTFAELWGSRPLLYHYKLMQKDGDAPGAWEWHQVSACQRNVSACGSQRAGAWSMRTDCVDHCVRARTIGIGTPSSSSRAWAPAWWR